MTDSLLVNSIYPLNYFTLQGVDDIQYPDQFWWSSKQRYASEQPGNPAVYLAVLDGGSPTSEYLEIDLGRVREVNYISMDALRVPVDITIEYDVISGIDGSHEWVEVQRREDMNFTERLTYDANNRNAWYAAEFYFTDPKLNIVNTRFLRIRFSRRDEAWPVSGTTPFRWPIFVKNLRSGRYIGKELDTVGMLLGVENVSGSENSLNETAFTLEDDSDTMTREARQRFRLPSDAARGSVVPDILGFGFLVETNEMAAEDFGAGQLDIGEHQWQWSLYQVQDTTVPSVADILITSGTVSGVVSEGKTWIDFYLPDDVTIATDPNLVYELRLRSLNPVRSRQVYLISPAQTSLFTLAGTFGFTAGSATVSTTVDQTKFVYPGDFLRNTNDSSQTYTVSSLNSTTITLTASYTGTNEAAATVLLLDPVKVWDDTSASYKPQAGTSLSMRVWSNIADVGRDVLGNSYRYATTKDRAANVFDGTKAGWMSAPQPSPNAVEALYFDIRQQALNADGALANIFGLIDAIAISPRTPGVTMHIYYSQSNLIGEAPATREQYDNLIWNPITDSFILRHNSTIELPTPIKGSFIKLEFTNLRPLPFRVPSQPDLPPVNYFRYPTWVEQQYSNTQVSTAVNSWFSLNATPVQQLVLAQITDPVAEFQYKQREFLAALSLAAGDAGSIINDALVDTSNQASVIDPVTAQRIYIQPNDSFQNTLLLNVDQNTILGQIVAARYDGTLNSQSFEAPAPDLSGNNVPLVSSITDRITESYSALAQTPLKFNQRSRHVYKIEAGQFNGKAYFVGIDEVAFLRSLVTQVHDDAVITDILYDDAFFVTNTWERENHTQIDDGLTVYLSYEIGDPIVYTDEAITFSGFAPVRLQGQGGQAINARMFAGLNRTGIEYFLDWDFDLSFSPDEFGTMTNFVSRSSLTERLTAPKQSLTYKDAGTVIGHALIPSPPTLDAAVVTGVAVPITTAEGKYWEDSLAVSGHAVISDVQSFQANDVGTVSGTAVPSSVNIISGADAVAVVGVAVPITSVENADIHDAATVVAVAQPSASTSALFGQGVFGRSDATFQKLDTDWVDTGTVTAVAAPSGTDTKTP